MHADRWSRIETLYELVRRQDPARQASILAAACGEDQDLRQQVEMLLGQAETRTNATGTVPTAADWKSTPGAMLGPYRILAPLGAGGMGEVYRGEDTRLGRQVAIKLLPASQESSPELHERFGQEARAASALNHPNIVTIYDVGAERGQSYIVMELIEGQTLRETLRSGPLAVSRMLPVASQVADALAAAHARGIIHRDLKPANIMLTNDGRVKILDFGLAKQVSGSPGSATPEPGLTTPGSVMGTVAYMSPEQARGEKADFRSDQFSLGAVLYEMITGRRAFHGPTEMDTLAAVLRDQPEPIHQLSPHAPTPLQWAIERCLSKNPSGRYSSTRQLLEDLTALAEQSAQARTDAAPRHNLPAQRTALIGRHREIDEILQLVLLPAVRLVTLTGPGGIGKTRLAVEAGRRLLEHFPGGVYFVPLEKIASEELVCSEIAAAFNVPAAAERSLEAALRDHLRKTRAPVLLILDNFEHVLGAAGLVTELLTCSDRLKAIATSRAALRVYGERDFAVPPLEIPRAKDVAELVKSPAVTLFLDRAAGLRPGAKTEEEQIRLAAEICARLDGLPLAIELAAARTRVLPLRALLDRLRDPLQLLAGGARDMPQRQQTLRATLDWSYNLLDAEQQKLFRRMSVFVGGATHEAIEAVCNAKDDLPLDFLDAVEALVDNSLVRRAGGETEEPRFVMLETMREYGLARLAEAGEEAYTRKAHAAYFLVLAEEPGQISELALIYAKFTAEIGNFRAALDWLASAGEGQWGLRLGTALGLYWARQGLAFEGRERLRVLLELPQAARRNSLRAWALSWAGDLDFQSVNGQPQRYYAEALEIFRELGDKAGVLRVVNSRAGWARVRGDYQTARAGFEEAVRVAGEIGDAGAVAGALSNLADVIRLQGEPELARQSYVESMRLFEQAGDRSGAAYSLSHQADLLVEAGHLEQARTLCEQALAQFRDLGEEAGLALCHTDLGNVANAAGDYAAARDFHRKALRIYWNLGQRGQLSAVFEALAMCLQGSGRPELALTFAGNASALRQSLNVFASPASVAKLGVSLDAARRQLTGSAATEAWIRGWNMPLEEAVRLALELE